MDGREILNKAGGEFESKLKKSSERVRPRV